MPRSTALPAIPVKTALVTKRIQMTPALSAEVDAFCDYYEVQKGARPEPSAAIVALLEDVLGRNRDFQRYRKDRQKPAGKRANAAASGSADGAGAGA